MDIAERNGSALRRWLCSAECFSDSAICRGSFQVNTPGSRSKALLVSVTCCDQRLLPGFLVVMWTSKAEIRASELTADTCSIPAWPFSGSSGTYFRQNDDIVLPVCLCTLGVGRVVKIHLAETLFPSSYTISPPQCILVSQHNSQFGAGIAARIALSVRTMTATKARQPPYLQLDLQHSKNAYSAIEKYTQNLGSYISKIPIFYCCY